MRINKSKPLGELKSQKAQVTAQQLIFCIALVRDKNMDYKKACQDIGIKPNIGRKWLESYPEVQKKVDQLIKERCERLLIDADTVVVELMRNARTARARGMIREANESLVLLGRHLNMKMDGQGGGGNNGTQVIFGGNQVALSASGGAASLPAYERGPVALERGDVVEADEGVVISSEPLPGRADMPGELFAPKES